MDIAGNHGDQEGWSFEKVLDMRLVSGYTWIFPEVYKDNRHVVYES